MLKRLQCANRDRGGVYAAREEDGPVARGGGGVWKDAAMFPRAKLDTPWPLGP